MKKMILLLLVLAACTAQPSEHAGANHVVAEQMMKVHADKDILDLHDFKVEFKRPQAESGAETLLQFELDKDGKALQLQPLHEKMMHLILVRKDLRYFDHVHPVQDGKTFSIPYTFAAPGEYRMWIEFSNGTLVHNIDYVLSVEGDKTADETERLEGLKIEFNQPAMKMDAPVILAFSVSDNNGKEVAITEPLLGAAAHLILVDDSLEEFAHMHDEKLGSSILSFSYTPEKAGNHTAWIEFRKNGKEQRKRFDFAVANE